jgi:arylsulfatase A-like enzyme
MLSSAPLRAAFDTSSERESLKDRYGRTKIGGRCLLARRLVEAGARFVMVDYGYDPEYGNLWDNHAVPVQKQPHISEMARRGYHLAGIDLAFSALLGDLDERGLLAGTLVVFLTEFGRTPKINSNGGRDHWGPAGSIFFAGGGVRGGQVIGATDKHGANPTTRPHSPCDVAASIYRAIGIDPATRLVDRQARPVGVLPHGEPIAELF